MEKIIPLVLSLSFLAFAAPIKQDLLGRLYKESAIKINAMSNSGDNKRHYYNGTNLISNLYTTIPSMAYKEKMMTTSGIVSSVFFTNDTEADSFNEANPRLKTNKYLILSGVSLASGYTDIVNSIGLDVAHTRDIPSSSLLVNAIKLFRC